MSKFRFFRIMTCPRCKSQNITSIIEQPCVEDSADAKPLYVISNKCDDCEEIIYQQEVYIHQILESWCGEEDFYE